MNAFEDGNNSNNDNNNNDNNNDPPGTEQGVVKKGKGRQKIRMAKIENDTNLQVTFSKRRAGVFKKASELSTLCGAESAVVVFSPGNKPHSFGHPDVETVANRFLHASSNEVPPRSNADQLILAHSEAAMQQRNHELIGIEAELERERQRKSALLQVTQHPLHDLNYQQLDQLKQSVLGFKQDLEAKVKNTAVLPYAPPFVNPGDLMNAAGGNGSYGTSFGLSSSSMNYGYTVQYPPVGAGSSSARAGSFGYEPSSGDGGGSQAAGNDDGNLHQGFGGEYRRPDQF